MSEAAQQTPPRRELARSATRYVVVRVELAGDRKAGELARDLGERVGAYAEALPGEAGGIAWDVSVAEGNAVLDPDAEVCG